MLSRGIGAGKNSPEANIWFLKDAGQGFVDSQFNLGLLLLQGEGKNMPQHFTLASMSLESESRNRILEARNSLVLLARYMPEEQQITEAKLQARIWLAKHGSCK